MTVYSKKLSKNGEPFLKNSAVLKSSKIAEPIMYYSVIIHLYVTI